jgi:branched-chain amino acid transport system substrate-binding protein
MEENFAAMFPAEHVEGVYSCLDYYQAVDDAFSTALLRRYDERFPGGAKFTAGSAATGLYRGLKLWEAAVNEAGSLDQDSVLRALDHARIAQGPGGAAEMVPGQHHLRLNMYIAQVRDGRLKVVKSLGALDPKEAQVAAGPR